MYFVSLYGQQKLKLQDKDKAITDAWLFAIYTAITEHERLSISTNEDVGHKFSAVLTSSMRDEHTETVVRVDPVSDLVTSSQMHIKPIAVT